jgi:hypothetical protein
VTGNGLFVEGDLQFNADRLQHFSECIVRKAPLFKASHGDFSQFVSLFVGTASASRTFSWLRGLLCLFLFPPFLAPPEKQTDAIRDALLSLIRLPPRGLRSAFNALVKSPILISNILSATQHTLTLILRLPIAGEPHGPVSHGLASLIQFLWEANLRSSSPLPSPRFVNNSLTRVVRADLEFRLIRRDIFNYLDTGAAVHPLLKQQILKKEASVLGRFTLNVHRQTLLADFLEALRGAPRLSFQGQVSVKFLGEGATDTGGPSREFVHLLSTELFTDLSLFELVNRHQYYWFKSHITPDDAQHRVLWSGGALLRLAISNGITISIPLPAALFKILKEEPLTLADLAEIDPDFATSLVEWRQDYTVEGAE